MSKSQSRQKIRFYGQAATLAFVDRQPVWVEKYDLIARYDQDLKTVYCRDCGQELKNIAWAKNHVILHYGN